MIIITVGLMLKMFGVLPDNFRPAGGNESNQAKIKRPKSVKNQPFQQYIQDGDQIAYSGNLDSALETYRKASQLEPREYLPYEKIGDIYYAQKKYGQAGQNFDFAYEINPNKKSLQIKSVKAALGMRKVLDAKIKLEAISPDTQESLYYKGIIAAFLNDQINAKDLLVKSLTAGNDETLKQSAQKILTNFRDFELARDARIEFLQSLLAQSFDQAGQYGLAIELAFNVLKTQHDYRDVWIILGHAFLNEEKWADAQDALAKAIDLDASHPAAYLFRGIAKKNLRQTNEAIADFEAALKYGWKPRILAKQYIADAFFESQNFEKAFPIYKEIVATDASDINRFERPIALAINLLNKPKEALELANSAYKAHPETAMAHNLLGWALLANNDLAGSRRHLEEAIRRDPELPSAHLNLEQLLEREGKQEIPESAPQKQYLPTLSLE